MIYLQGKSQEPSPLDWIPQGQTAFAYLSLPRATPKIATPQKTPRPLRTKAEWAAIGLESDEQRKERQAMEKAHRTAQIIKRAPYSDAGRNFPGQADRTNVITGKRITARYQ